MGQIDNVRRAAAKIRQGEEPEIALDESLTDVLIGYPIGGAVGWFRGKSSGKKDASKIGLAAGLAGGALISRGLMGSWSAGRRAAIEADKLDAENDVRAVTRAHRIRMRRLGVEEALDPAFLSKTIGGASKALGGAKARASASIGIGALLPQFYGVIPSVWGGYQTGHGKGYEQGFNQEFGKNLATGAAVGTAGVAGVYGASRYLKSRARRRRSEERRRADERLRSEERRRRRGENDESRYQRGV